MTSQQPNRSPPPLPDISTIQTLLSTLETQIYNKVTTPETMKMIIRPQLEELRLLLQGQLKEHQHEDITMTSTDSNTLSRYHIEKFLRHIEILLKLLQKRQERKQKEQKGSRMDESPSSRFETKSDSPLEKSSPSAPQSSSKLAESSTSRIVSPEKDSTSPPHSQNDDQLQQLLIREEEAVSHRNDDQQEIEYIRENVRELLQLSNTMNDNLQQQEKQLDTIADNIEKSTVQVEKGVLSQKAVVKGASLGLLVGGAALGGVVGGPVGLYMGYQAAALGIGAAVGIGAGSVGGAMGGYGVGKVRQWVSGTKSKTRSEKRGDELMHALEKDTTTNS